jgi:phosphoribosylformylglycinamidine (FGAM) synthase-like enzyme
VVSVKPALLARVLDTTRQYKVAAHQIGRVTGDDGLRIEHEGHAVIDSPLEALRDAWAGSLERTLAGR